MDIRNISDFANEIKQMSLILCGYTSRNIQILYKHMNCCCSSKTPDRPDWQNNLIIEKSTVVVFLKYQNLLKCPSVKVSYDWMNLIILTNIKHKRTIWCRTNCKCRLMAHIWILLPIKSKTKSECKMHVKSDCKIKLYK